MKRVRHKRTFDKTPPRKATPKTGRTPVTVILSMRHSFNGKFYGPGEVRISGNKAQIFLNAEAGAIAKEYSLQRNEAYIMVNRGGVIGKRQVPAAQFDSILAQSEVAL